MRKIFKWGTLLAGLLAVGCGSDESFDFSQFQNATQPPVAVNDTFAVLGNGQLTGSVTANDTVNGAAVVQFQNPGTAGGTVQISANGQLTYTPPAGQSNLVDTFTYTLTNAVGSSTATVTVNIGARGFFVNNQAVGVETGSQQQPFNTLAEAVAAAAGVDGAQIVLFRGDGTTTGLNTPVALGTNQGLSSLDPASPANITGPITLSNGNTVAHVRIQGTAGDALSGVNSVGGTLTGLTIDGPTGSACSLVNATGTFSASNCTLSNVANHGFIASADSTSLVWSVSGCSFSNVAQQAVFCNVTNTAAHNLTTSHCNYTGTGLQFCVVVANTIGTNVGLTMTNNTVNAGGNASRGLSVGLSGTSNFLGLISTNNITGCNFEGMQVAVGDNATARLRFTNNRILGNLANRGLVVAHIGAGVPNTGCIFNGNTSDAFVLLQNSLGVFSVEQFAQFNGASGNTGTVLTGGGTITDVAGGSLGIP